ncbi:MAG: hypothetical protein HQL44_12905 [Alphaproteobacteria bacterium]|nr:hypothetical protein [Alphaproteobacteria bacterium]
MTSQVSIGEQVAQMVDLIGAFYGLPQSPALSSLIETRSFETRNRLARLRSKPSQDRIRIAISIKGIGAKEEECLERNNPEIALVQPSDADIVITDPHTPDLDALLSADALRVFWAHDHHHTFAHYVMHLIKTNIVVPAHFCRRDHLAAFNRHIADTVPATTNQWSQEEIAAFSARPAALARHNALYGGFGAYDVCLDRSMFVGALMERLPEHALSVRRIQNADDPFFSMSARERYDEWRGYKVSLAAAINQDIPIRIFDALATGQIPIIPDSIVNLNWIISVEDQQRLGIERYHFEDPDSAISAWRRALTNFDRLGEQGIQTRIEYFLKNHSLIQRVEKILRALPI